MSQCYYSLFYSIAHNAFHSRHELCMINSLRLTILYRVTSLPPPTRPQSSQKKRRKRKKKKTAGTDVHGFRSENCLDYWLVLLKNAPIQKQQQHYYVFEYYTLS